MSLEDYPQQGSFAPRTLLRFLATTSPSATVSPFSPLPGASGYRAYPFPGDFSPRARRVSPVAVMSLPPCRRSHPAGVDAPFQPAFGAPMLPSPSGQGLGLWGNYFRGYPCVHFRCGLATCSPPFKMALSIGFQVFGFPPPGYPSYGASDFLPRRDWLPLNMTAFFWTRDQM